MTSKLGRRLCSVALPPISFCSHCQLLLPQSSILSLNFEMLPLWLVGLGCSEPSQCFQEESAAPSSKNCWLSASYFDPYITGNFVSCQSSLDPPWALAQASWNKKKSPKKKGACLVIGCPGKVQPSQPWNSGQSFKLLLKIHIFYIILGRQSQEKLSRAKILLFFAHLRQRAGMTMLRTK